MKTKRFTPSNLQVGILALLVIAAPFAMSMTPYEGIYDTGVWKAQFHLDPLNPIRVSLIVAGLLASCSTVGLLVWELSRAANKILELKLLENLVLKTSITLCSISIGWAAFPYWVNGVFQAHAGNPKILAHATFVDLDPKALMPEIWIGDLWSLGVLLILILVICLGPILFMLNLWFSISLRAWKKGLAAVALLIVSAAILFLSPDYWQWFMD